MKDNWKFNINIYAKAYLFSKIVNKLRVIIWYNRVESTVFLIEFNKLDMIYIDSINFLYKYKHNIFKETVHDNHYIDVNLPVSINE